MLEIFTFIDTYASAIQNKICHDQHYKSSCQVTFSFRVLFSINKCVYTTCVAYHIHISNALNTQQEQQKCRKHTTTFVMKYCSEHGIQVSNSETKKKEYRMFECCKFNDVLLVCDKQHKIKFV